MKIGFLPFYVELYEELLPEYHGVMQAFADRMAEKLGTRGFEVVPVPLCRVEREFAAAVIKFEDAGCQAIVTLHAAYSPSLESIGPLAATDIPLVVMDTTPDRAFGFDCVDRLMNNHGIHGVQDFCNLLLQRGKRFLIRAGHHEAPDFFTRLENAVRAAGMAHAFTHARVGTVGGVFDGMGDFRIPDGTFGMARVPFQAAGSPSAAEIAAEMEQDKAAFELAPGLSAESHRRTTECCLRLRKWIEANRLDAFTINFTRCTKTEGWAVVPFLECSKAMARGIGYAGEGDVLTALFCGVLMRIWKETTFSEMFCPDWAGNRIFVSHMGEINLNLLEQRPYLSTREWRFGDAEDPALATGCLKSGGAILANLAPGPDGRFTLIAAEIELVAQKDKNLADMRGWFVPPRGMSVGAFLEAYSRQGGTHHLVLSYGGSAAELRDFAHLMNWNFQAIVS